VSEVRNPHDADSLLSRGECAAVGAGRGHQIR
jgi:hypothetical protein